MGLYDFVDWKCLKSAISAAFRARVSEAPFRFPLSSNGDGRVMVPVLEMRAIYLHVSTPIRLSAEKQKSQATGLRAATVRAGQVG